MPVESLEPREVARRLDASAPPVLLDVREPDEFATAWIDGARHVPLRELPARLLELELYKDRDLVVYCHHGIRSQRAAQVLVQAGFSRVYNLTGGIDRWSLEVDSKVRRY
jgi:rhodanese-related sulfurtransferase